MVASQGTGAEAVRSCSVNSDGPKSQRSISMDDYVQQREADGGFDGGYDGASQSFWCAGQLADAVVPPTDCQCAECSPRNYHAIDCGQPHCTECIARKPGIQPWHAHQRKEGENIYSEHPSIMAQIYAAGKSIVVIVPNNEYVKNILEATQSARRYRDLKKYALPLLENLRGDIHDATLQYLAAENLQRALEAKIAKRASDASDELREQLKTHRATYDKARENCASLRNQEERLKEQLENAEKQWLRQMRQMCDEQDDILVDCGLLEDDGESGWEQATQHTSIHDNQQLDGQSVVARAVPGEDDGSPKHLTPVYQSHKGAPQGPNAFAPVHDEEGSDRVAETQRRAAELEDSARYCRQVLQDALEAHANHRTDYNNLRTIYIAEQQLERPDTASDLGAEYTPIYLRAGQKLTADLKAAEVELLEVEKQAWDAGISLTVPGDHDLEKDHEDAIAHENQLSRRTLDRAGVDQWMEDEMDAVSFASSIVEEMEICETGHNTVIQPLLSAKDLQREGDNVMSMQTRKKPTISKIPRVAASIPTKASTTRSLHGKRKAAGMIEDGQGKKRARHTIQPEDTEEPEPAEANGATGKQVEVTKPQRRTRAASRNAPGEDPPLSKERQIKKAPLGSKHPELKVEDVKTLRRSSRIADRARKCDPMATKLTTTRMTKGKEAAPGKWKKSVAVARAILTKNNLEALSEEDIHEQAAQKDKRATRDIPELTTVFCNLGLRRLM